MHVGVLLVRVYVHLMHAVPAEARRGHWNPWDWSYRQLLAAHIHAGNGTRVLWKRNQFS